MDQLIIDLFKGAGANWADFIILLMGLCVVAYLRLQRKEIKKLRHEAVQHDKLILLYGHIIKSKWGITSVKIHRSGDYEIVQPLNDE